MTSASRKPTHNPDLFRMEQNIRTRALGHHEFRCVVCGEPACHGYGVSLLRGVEGRWFCGAHKPAEPHVADRPLPLGSAA